MMIANEDMILWYEDDDMQICFSCRPKVVERFLDPYQTETEKDSILKKPYKNIKDLNVYIWDEETGQAYTFTIPKGYEFDGASIPCMFWRIVGANTDNRFMIAAMIHDFCCENHKVVGNNRYLSTMIFNNLLKVGGVPAFKRWLMKHSVDNWQKFCGWKG